MLLYTDIYNTIQGMSLFLI